MRYKVVVPYVVWAGIELEAINEEEAIEDAINETQLTNYCRHGETDRLIGSMNNETTIELSEDPLESGPYQIQVKPL